MELNEEYGVRDFNENIDSIKKMLIEIEHKLVDHNDKMVAEMIYDRLNRAKKDYEGLAEFAAKRKETDNEYINSFKDAYGVLEKEKEVLQASLNLGMGKTEDRKRFIGDDTDLDIVMDAAKKEDLDRRFK